MPSSSVNASLLMTGYFKPSLAISHEKNRGLMQAIISVICTFPRPHTKQRYISLWQTVCLNPRIFVMIFPCLEMSQRSFVIMLYVHQHNRNSLFSVEVHFKKVIAFTLLYYCGQCIHCCLLNNADSSDTEINWEKYHQSPSQV